MGLRAGQLCHRVDVQSVTATPDKGDVSDVWANTATSVPCHVSPIKPTEQWRVSEFEGRLTHKVVMRYDCALAAGVSGALLDRSQRLVFGGRYLYITGVINVEERNHVMEIYCTEDVT